MRSILLLPLVARCIETIGVYMAHVCFYVCCSDCVGVCGKRPLLKIMFFSLGVMKYVCVRGVVDVVFLFVL